MTDPLGEHDILRFRMLADPQLSPDGGQVAFVLVEQDADRNRQSSSIWSVSTEGTAAPRRLSTGPADGRPRWSPDGSRLAFLAAREREWARDLFVLDMRGGEARRVASLPRGILEFDWSPAGDRLCLTGGPPYPVEPDRAPPADQDEAHRRYRERVRHIRRFRYRFDGLGELDDEAAQVWVVDVDGRGLRMITEGASDATRPSWTAVGGIAFLSNRRPDFDRSELAEVYSVAPAGGLETRLTEYESSISSFGIAPDGRVAVLRTDVPDPFDARHHRLWVDGECLTREKDRACASLVLVDTMPRREPIDPTWADGWVYFELIDGGRQHVYRARPGTAPQVVLGGDRVVAGFSTNGATAAFLSSGPDDPLSLRLSKADGSEERVLFEPNPWVRERSLGALRKLDFEVDGEVVDGWALLPPGYRAGRVPALLQIHGGPHGAYGWSFQFVFQVLAGAGYAVLYCNPPGSQGYSEDFSLRLRGRWGELDFPYFMALVDGAVEAGFADPLRLGVGGASYGGFGTLWVIGHTPRFKAAVAARPVSALPGFYGSSDVGWNFLAAEMGAEPWEDDHLYERLSPLTYLGRVQTPLRLIGSTGDMRTPLEQAENVFIRMHKMGKDVDLVVFSGEPHALVVQGRPWNRVRHMQVVREWFDRHLQPILARVPKE